MLTIIHGENTPQSHNFLFSLLQSAQAKKQVVIEFTPEKLTPERLTSALEANLFHQPRLIIINSPQKLSPSLKKQTIALLKKHQKENNIVIFAEKALSSSWIKPFPGAIIRLFKPNPIIFRFLDSLGTPNKKNTMKLLNLTLKSENEGLLLYFLVKRIEDLILAKEGKEKDLSARLPWQRQKITKQSKNFTSQQLIKFISQLARLDYHQKTGQLPYSFAYGLELLINKL